MKSLKGKLAVVTGAGSGIGRALALNLAQRGCRVAASDINREAARITAAPATVIHARIEDVTPFPADVVVARALAPLDKLLGFASPFLGKTGVGLFLKGQDVVTELEEATRYWKFEAETVPSLHCRQERTCRHRIT